MLVLVPLLVTAIVPPHNWSWVHSSIHLSDLVLVLAGGRGSILGCEDEPSHRTSIYPYYAMHALPCFISLFHIFVALCTLRCSRDRYKMNECGTKAKKQCSVPAQYWTASCNINIINIGRTLAPSSCWSRHTGSTTLGARELCKLSDTIIPD